jgi:hypothetical protein
MRSAVANAPPRTNPAPHTVVTPVQRTPSHHCSFLCKTIVFSSVCSRLDAGSNWSYTEAMPSPSPELLMAPAMTAGIGLALGALTAPVIGPFLRKRLLPAPGAGAHIRASLGCTRHDAAALRPASTAAESAGV